MGFFKLFQRELLANWRQLVFLAAASGIANAAVLAIINWAASNMSPDRSQAGALTALAVTIVLYTVSQKALMTKAADLAETTIDSMRIRFIRSLQSADLVGVERLNRSQIYNCIRGEMQVVSDGALNLVIIGQALILVLVTLLYLAWLSFAALALAVLFTAIAASFHISRTRQIGDQLSESFRLGTALLDAFTDFVDGFKEVKLNTDRSDELVNRVRILSGEVTRRRLETRHLFTTDFVASQVAFFLLTGIMVFVVPLFTQADRQTTVMITTTSLFLIGPISVVVGGLPVLQRVDSAATTIQGLEDQLARIGRAPEPRVGPDLSGFQRLTLEGVTFEYGNDDGDRGFAIGPIDLDIARNQVVFITGGNGSGKSTLLKLICGLYSPAGGCVHLDGTPITPENQAAYRNLFSAIFSENHLFKELYGVREIDPDKARTYLTLLEMENKVDIVGRAFTTTALSSGQRKRLAMISVLLEDRPICVFDEWAADQDPYFRKKFYREIIPRLKQDGKTIIAITHDDRYFDAADIRVHLDEGRLQAMPDPGRDDQTSHGES